MTPRVGAWLTAAGLTGLLVASGAVAALTPEEEQWASPFAVEAAFDQRVSGRNIAATVHSAVVADEVSDDSWSSGEGNAWVVVDASVEAVTTETSASLTHAALVIDGVTYTASDRPDNSTLRQGSLSVGIPLRGMLAFEVPASLVSGDGAVPAELHLALHPETRLDSLIVVKMDVAELPHDSSATLTDPSWGRG